LLEERPFLKAIGVGKPDDPMLAVFKIYTGEAHFWTMENNMREAQVERVKF
jgi:pyridoxamine 5'-phosphate oxidase